LERLGTALLALGSAVAIALWIYGIYCYVQMVRHRATGANPLQLAWPREQLTPLGREFRRKALRAYAGVALLAVGFLILTTLLGHR
jgi:hypothetical protein